MEHQTLQNLNKAGYLQYLRKTFRGSSVKYGSSNILPNPIFWQKMVNLSQSCKLGDVWGFFDQRGFFYKTITNKQTNKQTLPNLFSNMNWFCSTSYGGGYIIGSVIFFLPKNRIWRWPLVPSPSRPDQPN